MPDRPQVFLSYAGPERLQAMQIRSELELRGVTVVMDDRFEPGRSVMVNVGRALHETSVVVALVSSRYLDRHFTEIEVSAVLASPHGRLLPVVIGPEPQPETEAGIDLWAVLRGRSYFSLNTTSESFDELASTIFAKHQQQRPSDGSEPISSTDLRGRQIVVTYDWEDSHYVDGLQDYFTKLELQVIDYRTAGALRKDCPADAVVAVLWTPSSHESPEIARVLLEAVALSHPVVYLTVPGGSLPPPGAEIFQIRDKVSDRSTERRSRPRRRQFGNGGASDLVMRPLSLNDDTPFHILADKLCLNRATARAAADSYQVAVYEMPPMNETRLEAVLAHAAVRRFIGDWRGACEVLTAEPLPEINGEASSTGLSISLELLSLEFELGRVYGVVGRAEALLAQCLAASDWPTIIGTHRQLGMIHKEQGRYSIARDHLQRAAHYSEDLRDSVLLKTRLPARSARTALLADCLRELAALEWRTGDLELAKRLFERALDESSSLPSGTSGYLSNVISSKLARVDYTANHDYEAAKTALRSCYANLQAYDNPIRLAAVLESLVRLEMDFSSHSDAQVASLRPTLAKVHRVRAMRGHDYMIARVTEGLGDLEYALGNWREAIDHYEFARSEFNRLGKVPEAANTACLLAKCLTHLDDTAGALELLGESLSMLRDREHKTAQAMVRSQIAQLTHSRIMPNQIDEKIEMTGVGEFSVHDWIAHGLLSRRRNSSPNIVLGVGDDAAILHVEPGEDVLTSTDSVPPALLKTDDLASADYAARFAIISSLSDVLAMAGEPIGILLNLHLRRTTPASWARALLRSAAEEAAKYGVAIVGGDLKERAADGLTTTVIGKVASGRALRRSGASVGDLVAITVSPGADGIWNGLGTRWAHELLPHLSEREKKIIEPLVARNAKYSDLGLATDVIREISRAELASAAIDTSDGLLACAQLIGEASNVGIELYPAKLNSLINKDVQQLATALGISPFLFAMNAGHDWEIVLTIKGRRLQQLETIGKRTSSDEYPTIAVIGRVVDRNEWSREGVRLVNEGIVESYIIPFFTDEKFVARPYELRARDWLEFARDATRRALHASDDKSATR